ncbi:MAG: DNA-binding protein [Nitrospirae bacterium]|uniref:PPC domain-containing DNA-binding protein n=1 Tax=Candidatus Magnetobacterium casense TaxID=1455061 RepID=UPI00058E435D|nr:PPC domain-containing DNA-binding protein [Candidatus Magnetobacterium casensis]MBF0338577.1 DNA-binding protein [Nitrospirota bacterium]
MKYQIGTTGRVFVCRLADGEDLLKALIQLATDEGLNAAIFHVVGGMRGGSIVVGPETEEMPIKPDYRKLNESHEVTGMGTIFLREGVPAIHFHGAFGKKDNVRVGCLRDFSEIFLVLEVIVTELVGIDAKRQLDELSGMYLLQV